MANSGSLTYFPPKSNFEMIHTKVIMKFDPEVVGIYCKLVTMSSGKTLSIAWLSKRLGINERRMRKTIVQLESEGYITREPLRDDDGKMKGWHYKLWSEPVKKDDRTCAGKKKDSDLTNNRLDGSPSCPKTDKSVEGQDNSIYTNSISTNNTDLDNKQTEKELFNNNSKKRGVFVKPTIQEVADYIREKNLHFSAELFYEHYESNGWMVGKNKMKDWQACCRYWEQVRKSKRGEEEKEEEIPEERLQGWERSQEWMRKFIPRIASMISFTDFDTMRGLVYHDREIFSDILQEINNSDYEGDIVKEFGRLSQQERYNEKMFRL